MNRIAIDVVRLPHADGLPLPAYQSDTASGMDLLAAVKDEGIVIGPGRSAMIPTGIAIAIPVGLEGQVRPRSGLAAKHAVTVLNAPGTIDPDYRGEICVLLVNLGHESFFVSRGMRIAQLVIVPVVYAQLRQVEKLDETGRGGGGFGSTGVASSQSGTKR